MKIKCEHCHRTLTTFSYSQKYHPQCRPEYLRAKKQKRTKRKSWQIMEEFVKTYNQEGTGRRS